MSEKIPGAEKKIICGVFGILLGSLGIHKFILGYVTEGILMLVVTICWDFYLRHRGVGDGNHRPDRRHYLPHEERRRFRQNLHHEQERLVLNFAPAFQLWSMLTCGGVGMKFFAVKCRIQCGAILFVLLILTGCASSGLVQHASPIATGTPVSIDFAQVETSSTIA